MGKTLLYLAIFLVLCAGVYFFFFSNKDNPYGNKEAGFNVKDTAAIGKIFIASNDNSSVLVERTPDGWMVNKKYKVLPSTLDMLLTTLYQQQPLYPVQRNFRDNIIKYMAGSAIKVELYDRDGKKMRTFYVGEESAGKDGTYMVMEGAQNPYVVQIQGLKGYLTPRYTSYLKDWRDRTVFNLTPDQIKSVRVQYFDHPINSFTINQGKDTVTVTTDSAIMRANKYNSRRAHVYLKFFHNINCEGYLNGVPGMDTLLKMMPKMCTIDVTDTKGADQHVDIYWMPVNKRSKNLQTSDVDVPDDYDADRFYAVMNGGVDTAMIQRFVFQKMFRKGYEFYSPDVQPAPLLKEKVPYIK